MKVKEEFKGLNKTQLKREKQHIKWRIQMAKNCMFNTEKAIYRETKRTEEVIEEKEIKRAEALDDYLAGNIDQRTYRIRVTEYDTIHQYNTDFRRRFTELDDFISEQQENLKQVNWMLTRSAFDMKEPISKYNQPGQARTGNSTGNPNIRNIRKKGVTNPWGCKGKPKEVKEAEEKARREQDENGEYWKR